MERNVRISGMGMYTPKRKVTSSEVDSMIGAHEGWSERKSGVRTRYYADGETASFMGAEAVRRAIADAGLTCADIDCIVCGSGTVQQAIPCTASLIQEQLGLLESGIPCFDVNATCLSWVTALDMMSYAVAAGRYKNVVIVSSEISSVGLNWGQNESSILFGDGAAAIVLSASHDGASRILASHMETYSIGAHLSEIRGGGTMMHPREYREDAKEHFLFDMDGRAIFKLSSKHIPAFLERLFSGTGMSLADVTMVVPHQASGPSMKLIRKKLGVSEDQFMSIIEDYGNMISASIPFALYEGVKRGKIQRGDTILLLGTSAGLSIGGIVLDY